MHKATSHHGYTTSTISSHGGVEEIATSETKCQPFQQHALDRVANKIELKNGALYIPAMRLVVKYLNSSKFRKKSPRTIENILYDIARAASFFNGLPFARKLGNDRSIFEVNLKNWLIEKGYSETSIGGTLNTLVHAVKMACQLSNTDHLKNDAVRYICRFSVFFRAEGQATATLDSLHPELSLKASDKELLIGLRETMAWFLEEMAAARELLNANLPESLKAYLCSLREKRELPTCKERHFAAFDYRHCGQPYDKLMVDLTTAIVELKRSHINELMFCNMNSRVVFETNYQTKKSYLSSDELEEYFADLAISRAPLTGFNKTGVPCGQPLPALKVTYSGSIERIRGAGRTLATFPTLSFLIYPTIDESLAMEWLLASERIQLTGIRNLNIWKNVLWDKKKKNFQFKNIIKHRSTGQQHSNIYQNDVLYKIYTNWINLLRNAEEFVSDLGGEIIPPFIKCSDLVRSQRSFHQHRIGFWLMAIPGTHTQNKLLSDLRHSPNIEHVKTFLLLLEAHLSDSKRICRDRVERRKARKGRKVLRQGLRDPGQPKEPAGIGVKTISQTRAVLDDDIMTGRLVGHSPKTHHDVYVNRTRSKYVNAESASFAADVGNAMKEAAEKLLQGVELVSTQQIKQVLGLSDTPWFGSAHDEIKKIIDHAEQQGFLCNIVTELTKGNQTYIIVSPWSAALIEGYVMHIEDQKRRIEFNNPQKRQDILLKQAYLTLLLERFPQKVLDEGRVILREWNIPYPSLS